MCKNSFMHYNVQQLVVLFVFMKAVGLGLFQPISNVCADCEKMHGGCYKGNEHGIRKILTLTVVAWYRPMIRVEVGSMAPPCHHWWSFQTNSRFVILEWWTTLI